MSYVNMKYNNTVLNSDDNHAQTCPSNRVTYNQNIYSKEIKRTYPSTRIVQKNRSIASYATTQTRKNSLQQKLDIIHKTPVRTNKYTQNKYSETNIPDRQSQLPNRILRIQSVRRPSNNVSSFLTSNNSQNSRIRPRRPSIHNGNSSLNNTTCTPSRNSNRGIRSILKGHRRLSCETTVTDIAESTYASNVDCDTNSYDEDITFDSPTACLDIVNDFEVLMSNLNQSQIMFDLFPQQLQTAVTYLQRADFSYTSPFDSPVLPRSNTWLSRRPTLVLDLDETLMHCAKSELHTKPHFMVQFDGYSVLGNIYVRPYAVEFLKAVSAIYEVVIFTASTSPYANQVLDTLDPNGEYIHHRLYRQHCTFQCGGYVKDLNILGRDLKSTILVDNSPISAAFQLDNLVPISSWHGDETDRELYDLLHHLMGMADISHMPKYLSKRYGFREWINAYRDEPNYNDHADEL